MSGDRETQQKQVDSIKNELEKLGVSEDLIKDELHDVLHGNDYNYKDALDAAKEHFGVNE